jgi:hypothetical protein
MTAAVATAVAAAAPSVAAAGHEVGAVGWEGYWRFPRCRGADFDADSIFKYQALGPAGWVGVQPIRMNSGFSMTLDECDQCRGMSNEFLQGVLETAGAQAKEDPVHGVTTALSRRHVLAGAAATAALPGRS